MVSLRQSAYSLALLFSWLEIISAFYEFQRRVGPLLKAGKDDALANAPTLKQVNEEMAKRKHGLFMEYDKFAPEYKFLYFIYCPAKWAFMALDWYKLRPI